MMNKDTIEVWRKVSDCIMRNDKIGFLRYIKELEHKGLRDMGLKE
jgi:hypothetical protein